jgi:hypothetical protein
VTRTFEPNIDRDAVLVAEGMRGGFQAVCSRALLMSQDYPELAGGPDTVIAHGEWLKAQPPEYVQQMVDRMLGRGGMAGVVE